MGLEGWRLWLGGSYDLELRFWVDGETQSFQALSMRSLLAVVRPSFGVVLHGGCVFTRPLCPVPGTLGPRITDRGEEVVRVVVSCDMGPRGEGGSEDEGVEFGISPLDLLRLLWFFGDRRVLGEESENAEFCLNVQTGHGEDSEDEKKETKERESGGGEYRRMREKKKVSYNGRSRSGLIALPAG